MLRSFLVLITLFVGLNSAQAAPAATLTINAVEWGVGKFHRMDNKAHPYQGRHAWTSSIIPDEAKVHPLTYTTGTNTYTIQFYTLEEVVKEVIRLSTTTGLKVGVLNMHGHGMPGGMWFPKDAAELRSWGCREWVESAEGDDQGNYDQYYSVISKEELDGLKVTGERPANFPCVTNLNDWVEVVGRNGGLQQHFTPDSVVNFLSCLVGFGTAGNEFTLGVARLLLPLNGRGMVKTSIPLGLGDWSMPHGMGFWDYQNDEQLARDNEIYPRTRKDADIAQRGSIRIVTNKGRQYQSMILQNQTHMDFMAPTSKQLTGQRANLVRSTNRVLNMGLFLPEVTEVRVPGTGVILRSQSN